MHRRGHLRKGLDERPCMTADKPMQAGILLMALAWSPGTGATLPEYHRPVPAYRAKPPRSRYNITIPLEPPQPGLPRPRIDGPAGRPLVVLDPGHGGHDPGAASATGGLREKDVTLSIARTIREELLRSGRVRVALTRDDDRFLILHERSAIARAIGADLFISIHADSAANDAATGATVYTLSDTASDREALAFAQRENRADVVNGVNLGQQDKGVATILMDLAQRETRNASAAFAELLRREGQLLIPFRKDPLRRAGFVVLKAPDTPAILLEVGYLTNASDSSRLASEEGRNSIAVATRRAVEIHFARQLVER